MPKKGYKGLYNIVVIAMALFILGSLLSLFFKVIELAIICLIFAFILQFITGRIVRKK